jgi:hypothetical protein
MRNAVFTLVTAGIFSLGVATAESPSVSRCAGEIGAMHGVWAAPESFLPVYGDWKIIAYLATVKGPGIGVPVLPVFSPEPLYFRSAHVVFVSTGFLLSVRSDQELADAIDSAPLTVLTRALPACSAIKPIADGGLAGVQERLSQQLTAYDEVTTRRLHRR